MWDPAAWRSRQGIGDQRVVTARKNSPVFVIGCHRSGTALLYDSLLSAGGFPLYHQAPYVHTTLLRMCGGPVSSQEPREGNATLAAEQAVPANGPGRGG